MAIKNSSVTATTAANIYVSSGNTVITTIHLCNYSGSVVTANLYLAPSGNVAGVNNIIYANTSISAYNTLIIYQEKFVLNNGDTIQANCSAGNAVTATISYLGY
jgi:hypothetical protein